MYTHDVKHVYMVLSAELCVGGVGGGGARGETCTYTV